MRRKVDWSDKASTDLFEQIAYKAADNPFAADRTLDRVLQVADALGDMATGRRGRVSGTYEKSVPKLPYILVYALIASDGHEVVSIVRLIHTARDWPDEQWPE